MDDALPITIDAEMIAQHLNLLFTGTDGYVPIRILQEKDGVAVRKQLPFLLNDADLVNHVAKFASAAAASGAASFLVPGTVRQQGSAKKADIAQMTCLLVDLDSGDIAGAKAHLEEHLGPASLAVMSGGVTQDGQDRLHLYWRLISAVTGSNLARLCELRGKIAEKVGGDTSFASPHQPIRLAGSIYAKSGVRRLVRIVDQSELRHELAKIDDAVCAMPTLAGLAVAPLKIATGAKGPTASDLKLRKIRSEARDDVTRFDAIGKVVGHWLHTMRQGSITIEQAWVHVQDHNEACIDPPWEKSRLRESFDAILARDVKQNGLMPDFGADLYQTDGDGGQPDEEGSYPKSSTTEVTFLSEDDLANRFAARFRGTFRHVAARGCWMTWAAPINRFPRSPAPSLIRVGMAGRSSGLRTPGGPHERPRQT